MLNRAASGNIQIDSKCHNQALNISDGYFNVHYKVRLLFVKFIGVCLLILEFINV